MTTKQRAYLKSLAMNMEAILQIGKNGLTDENIESVEEAISARELIKITVLKNCEDDTKELAMVLAEKTDSEIVQIIGRKLVLFREARVPEKRKIVLPK